MHCGVFVILRFHSEFLLLGECSPFTCVSPLRQMFCISGIVYLYFVDCVLYFLWIVDICIGVKNVCNSVIQYIYMYTACDTALLLYLVDPFWG